MNKEMDTECDDDSRTLFCANLHKRVTEEILYELFLQVGPVQRVKIPANNNYGFVTYRHLCSIDYALEVFKNTELYGNPLKIKRRQTKNDTNDKQNSNNVLQMGNTNFIPNMPPNMMPSYPHQNTNYYNANNSYKHDRSRSPSRNRYNNHRQDYGSHYMSQGRYDHSNKRYDHDDKYDHKPRHNDRRNHKRHKR